MIITSITLFSKEENKNIYENSETIYTTKAIDNLILDDKNQEEVIEDFKTFLNKKDWYFNYGIPYKRNYYLYSLSGTGKTSIPKVLAKNYNYELYNINFNDFDNEKIIYKIPIKDIIVLIDEFNYPSIGGRYKNLLRYLNRI